jgi:dienelactone hydrolase
MKPLSFLCAAALCLLPLAAQPFSGTQPLTMEGDIAAQLVTGLDRYLDRVSTDATKNRARHWHRDFSSTENYLKSIEPNRQRLAEILGVVDKRDPAQLRHVGVASNTSQGNPAQVGQGPGYRIFAVEWNVLRGIKGEGLLLVPDGVPKADVVAVPDCDWTPEQAVGLQSGVPESSQFARKLAASGCRVIVPTLIDRSDTNAGLPGVRKVRQTQREVLWRAAYEMGRTLQGYEVQKVLAAIDWFSDAANAGPNPRPIGVIGWGEGGMVAFYAAALDQRIQATAISGFNQNPNLENEPIYRNVWSITDQFGGAEIAGLIAPRRLVWEIGKYPVTEYPPAGQRSDGAAPGKLGAPDSTGAEERSRHTMEWLQNVPGFSEWKLVRAESNEIFNDESHTVFADFLGVSANPTSSLPKPTDARPVDTGARMLRQYSQLLEDTQWLMRESEFTRKDFWKKVDRKSPETFAQSAKWYRDYFFNEIVGPLPAASLPPNPRTRKVSETESFTGYEVVLDVHPDVIAYGILLVPKGIKDGERRPVVICQHGLEGRPTDVADPKKDHPAYHTYACRLAERGFITFAPQNAYIGENRFRQVLRKAQPLKLSLWSFIHRQHEVILDWLASQNFVDPSRMAFYGLSYGGKTAVRIPTLLDRYCLSICSADYNEWIWKNVSARHGYSYLYWGEYDMPEFNLGNTFNYSELSWLMIPRPFMVERGHEDGVAPDEWVAYEFAKTRRQYVKLGLGDRTEIEFFDGPHTINGKGTFDFLHKHLKWPKP